jgi:hypothetical protein
MGFNKRKMEAQRAAAAEKEVAVRRATEAQILEDAGRLVAAWNERQARRMPMLFSPTIGCALKARHWFLWVRGHAVNSVLPKSHGRLRPSLSRTGHGVRSVQRCAQPQGAVSALAAHDA